MPYQILHVGSYSLIADVDGSSPDNAFDSWWEGEDLGACCPFDVIVHDVQTGTDIYF